ncbi:hypothetical protein TNCT_105931 [Trichonephila clavata]|uniref:Uncharacterized protein n=1 Tax=Trichonephila clavata TaxID=2740835 RepID=A0A8X6F605_TRICU|nr:hypothetical protein TNCT_105931 [Trichonephila clavata]
MGSVADHPGRGAHRNIRTEENGETGRQSVADDPSVSIRRHSSQLDISNEIASGCLDLHPRNDPGYKYYFSNQFADLKEPKILVLPNEI